MHTKRHWTRALGALALTLAIAPTTTSAAPPGAGGVAVSDPLTIHVDSTLTGPDSIQAPAGDQVPRPMGRVATPDGTSRLVLDEVIVSVDSGDDLRAFLDRHDGTLIDSFPSEPDEPQTHLVRIATGHVAAPADVAKRLEAIESHSGTMRVDSHRTLALLDVLATESVRTDVVGVTLNWAGEPQTIPDGTMYEHPYWGNVFDWPHVTSAGPQAIGLDFAWQLLAWKGKLKPQFTALISDGGFVKHDDLPSYTLRDAAWNATHRWVAPNSFWAYHGTAVALALAAIQDNDFYVAGPAGPVISDLVAVAMFHETWRTMRKLEERVDTYRPAIVNMSWRDSAPAGKEHFATFMDDRFKRMVADGALLLASADNEGANVDAHEHEPYVGFEKGPLVYPCESAYVLCVGGLAVNSTARANDSNYGTDPDNPKSVEIYGPYCVPAFINPHVSGNTTPQHMCGTSISSPTVAGVALLANAANPSLGPGALRQLLLDTAHRGVGNLPDASFFGHARINAGAAVEAALGVKAPAPKVTITSPHANAQSPPGEGVLLAATAKNFAGRAMPVRWESSRDGELFGGDPVTKPDSVMLSPGVHVLTARADDIRGTVGSDSVTVKIQPNTPAVLINSPGDLATVPEGGELALDGSTQSVGGDYSPLPDSSVRWEVRHVGTGALVYSGHSHRRAVAAGVLKPGAYTIRFFGDPGFDGGIGTDEVQVIVTDLKRGQVPPIPLIYKPGYTDEFVLYKGSDSVDVQLRGLAADGQDGPPPGTALQWVAQTAGGRVVLCTGSQFPQAANDAGAAWSGMGAQSIATVNDCSKLTVPMTPPPKAPVSNSWVIELRAVDSDGVVSAPETRRIVVRRAPET